MVLIGTSIKGNRNHSFIVYRLSDLYSGHGEPVPISGIIGHQGRIHSGRSANPSQGTHTHSHNTDSLEKPINLQCMSLDQRRKPPRHRENMQTGAGIEPPTLEVWGKRANH
ncbi:hypothetical protein QTP70_031461 [Hemibagrus guttatus]|uniref:Uncharacterized protein n=1 Tax=Hemibagrus guttatus TaxID=175788 RepID=A0AAE0RC46_9TELE|nr:hypothetical protein QTP70_031461 [Hemibagrus guttatus]